MLKKYYELKLVLKDYKYKIKIQSKNNFKKLIINMFI